jgi:lipopolysaccharide/colanic/teichoic acid biosynthesis glycosyltransferase
MPKRVFDLIVASLALLLLSPVICLAALWVKLDSPGPAMFRQQRVGRGGQLFRIHKLRTMYADDTAASGLGVTVHADVRVTRAGHWLRRRRIDELPQLIDVLLGHMSLVGPRPELPQYVALYPAPLREQVLAVKPGITDPASLEFADETARLVGAADPETAYVEQILPRKLQRQAEYARRATLISDVAVLGRTLRVLLAR